MLDKIIDKIKETHGEFDLSENGYAVLLNDGVVFVYTKNKKLKIDIEAVDKTIDMSEFKLEQFIESLTN
jgi:hypothetical protein